MEALYEIQVDLDSVTVAHQVIKRPNRISRSDWALFWDSVKYRPNEFHCDGCGDLQRRY